MRPTVEQPIRTRRVEDNEVLFWVNKEAVPVLRQMRQAANFISRQQATFTSNALGTFQTIWTSADIPVNSAVRIDAQIIGYEGGNDVGCFTIIAVFRNNGTLAQTGGTTTLYVNNPGGYAVQFQVVGNHIELQGQDAGASINWTAVIDAQEQVGI